MADVPYRVLTLDGGGAKGFYTLGVLREVEALVGMRLHEKFDLIFGTSTGAIIAAMLALGHSVDEIHALYKKHVVTVMACKKPADKTAALKALATEVFKDQTFEDVKTGIGIVATKWINDRPMVFKASKDQAHGRQGTFKPGFGCTIADAAGAGRLKAIAFRCLDNPLGAALLDRTGALLHFAGHLRADSWNGKIGVQFMIDDAAPVGAL